MSKKVMVSTKLKNLDQGCIKLDIWPQAVETTTRYVGLQPTNQKGE